MSCCRKPVHTIIEGDVVHFPTSAAVFDALALKADITYVDGLFAAIPSQVIDSIADGDTVYAPSRNAVFDALALKLDAAAAYTDADARAAVVIDSIADADTDHAPSRNAVYDALALKADVTALALKADLASPVFTGNPTAPTPAPGDNDTSIATTAFVTAAVAGGGGGSAAGEYDWSYLLHGKAGDAPVRETRVGTYGYVEGNTLMGGGYLSNTSNAQHDSVAFKVWLGPGTYDLEAIVTLDPACAIGTWEIDDGAGTYTTIGTIDLYGVGTFNVRKRIIGFVIVGGGVVRRSLRCRMATRNVSATGWYTALHMVSVVRTA